MRQTPSCLQGMSIYYLRALCHAEQADSSTNYTLVVAPNCAKHLHQLNDTSETLTDDPIAVRRMAASTPLTNPRNRSLRKILERASQEFYTVGQHHGHACTYREDRPCNGVARRQVKQGSRPESLDQYPDIILRISRRDYLHPCFDEEQRVSEGR